MLALSVVIAHTGPIFGIRLVSGAAAVETFFIISGFYMALVINEKYFATGLPQRLSYRRFLEARALRLYPLYGLLLALTVAVQAALRQPGDGEAGAGGLAPALGFWAQNALHMHWSSLLLLGGVNLSLIGQDWVMFTGLNAHTGELFWTPNFWSVPLPGYHFLFVPQAWTLGLEIAFYLLAPFIVRRGVPFLLGIAALSFALKHVLAHFGLSADPWLYRFFPSELQYFVLGALGYKGYRSLQDRRLFQPWWGGLSCVCAAACLVLFPHFSSPVEVEAYYWLMAACIPLVFLLTKRIKIDRLIGEMSYPVYLCHVLVLQILSRLGHGGALSVCAATLVFAAILLYGFDLPLERLRQKWIEKQEAGAKNALLSDVSPPAAASL